MPTLVISINNLLPTPLKTQSINGIETLKTTLEHIFSHFLNTIILKADISSDCCITAVCIITLALVPFSKCGMSQIWINVHQPIFTELKFLETSLLKQMFLFFF